MPFFGTSEPLSFRGSGVALKVEHVPDGAWYLGLPWLRKKSLERTEPSNEQRGLASGTPRVLSQSRNAFLSPGDVSEGHSSISCISVGLFGAIVVLDVQSHVV